MNDYRIQVTIGSSHFEAEGLESSVRSDYDKFLAQLPLADTPNSHQDAIGFFEMDDYGTVVLKRFMRPPINLGTSLLLILYAFRYLSDQHRVSATELRHSALSSGLKMGRVDRTIACQLGKNLVLKSGSKRGTQYELRGSGIQYVESLLDDPERWCEQIPNGREKANGAKK